MKVMGVMGMEVVKKGANSGRASARTYIIPSHTSLSSHSSPALRAGKKNPELLARGREADFLKGSKAR
jgi:hypothetical protein